MLEATRLISNLLYINWSGCAPVIPALAKRRQEDLKFKVIPGDLNGELRVLAHSGVDTVSQGDKNAFKE